MQIKIFVIYILKYLILSEVDHISITLLMDNYTDRLISESYPEICPLMIKNERFFTSYCRTWFFGFNQYLF